MTVPSDDDKRLATAPGPAATHPPSFDPSTWLKPAGPAQEPLPTPPAASPSPTKPASRRAILVGAGGAAAVALIGAGMLLSRRPSKTALRARGQEQVLTLPDLTALDPALAAYGFAAEVRGRILAAARSALPAEAAAGELRMELELAHGSRASLLEALTLTRADGLGVRVAPAAQGFAATRLGAATTAVVKVAHGQMNAESFYSSAVSSGLIDALIPQFFQAFVYDFDFQREIQPGDEFEAAYEQRVNARQEPVGQAQLLYASMVTRQKSRALYRFMEPGRAPDWFDGAGRNIRRSLMRTPVEGARISSTFGMRDHPVLGFTRLHKGTDFATPVGTPVYASGAGRVTFVGPRGDFGNFITIQHTPVLETAYAHLSAFAEGLRAGSQVTQGQQIALSGNTGLTSGPHLHYEVRVDGQQVDSQTYQTQEGRSLTGAVLAAFTKERDRIDVARASSV